MIKLHTMIIISKIFFFSIKSQETRVYKTHSSVASLLCASEVLYVAFVLSLFVPHFVFLCCLWKTVIHVCGISCELSLIQSTLVISNSKGLSEILRDIRTSTYQICRI